MEGLHVDGYRRRVWYQRLDSRIEARILRSSIAQSQVRRPFLITCKVAFVVA
jgi:(2Fe-2S) ferredoxin